MTMTMLNESNNSNKGNLKTLLRPNTIYHTSGGESDDIASHQRKQTLLNVRQQCQQKFMRNWTPPQPITTMPITIKKPNALKILEDHQLPPPPPPLHMAMGTNFKQPQGQSPQSLPQTLTIDLMEPQSDCLDAAYKLAPANSESSMKVFSMIMLHAWRQRRIEVRRLQHTVELLKKDHSKSRNQLHVYSTLIRVEQKRNDQLTLQLKQSLMSVNKARSSCDNLTTSVMNLTADKALLEQELSNRRKEFEAIQLLMSQTKTDLFGALLEQRSLQTHLNQDQRTMQQLRQENQQLNEEMAKIRYMDDEYKRSEQKYQQELEQKNQMLKDIRHTVRDLEDRLRHWQVKQHELEQYRENEQRMTNEIKLLRNEIELLKQQNTSTPLPLVKIQHNPDKKDKNSEEYLTLVQLKNSLHRLMPTMNWEFMQGFAANIFYVSIFYLLPGAPPIPLKYKALQSSMDFKVREISTQSKDKIC